MAPTDPGIDQNVRGTGGGFVDTLLQVVHPANHRHFRNRPFRGNSLVLARELWRLGPAARQNGAIGTYRMDHLAGANGTYSSLPTICS